MTIETQPVIVPSLALAGLCLQYVLGGLGHGNDSVVWNRPQHAEVAYKSVCINIYVCM